MTAQRTALVRRTLALHASAGVETNSRYKLPEFVVSTPYLRSVQVYALEEHSGYSTTR